MKYSVLGFLIDQPMHGYELKRALSPALPPRQQVNDGVLYPLLKRLEAEGLVRKRVERGRGGRDRHVFHPTAEGTARVRAVARRRGRRERRGRLRLPRRPSVPDEVPVLRQADAGRGASRSSTHQLADCTAKLETFEADPRAHGRAGSGPSPHRGARPRHRTTEGEGAMAEANDPGVAAAPAREGGMSARARSSGGRSTCGRRSSRCRR